MFAQKLVVFTGAIHYFNNSAPVAHAGFVREIDIWARFFSKVIVVGFYSEQSPLADSIPYKSSNIDLVFWGPAHKTGGILGKLRLLYHIPSYLFIALKNLNRSDIVMARGPEAVGFLGALVSTLKSNVRFSRYTAEWSTYPDESILHKVEKLFYKWCFKAPVAIYGTPDPELPHLVPFVTSSISKADWLEAKTAIAQRVWKAPIKVLSVGRLSINKNLATTIHTIGILIERGYDIEFHIAGQGEEQVALERLIAELQLNSAIYMHGHLSWPELKRLYKESHILVHTAISEGFPKIFVEAMTYGIPIVASPAGATSFIIAPPSCGLVFCQNSSEEIADYVAKLLDDFSLAQQMGTNGHIRVYTEGFLLDTLGAYYEAFLSSITNRVGEFKS